MVTTVDQTMLPSTKKVGVLALQGDFAKHMEMLGQYFVSTVQVKKATDLESLDLLVLPGGESSTMIKLLQRTQMWDAVAGFPGKIWGTCAGAILLAAEVRPDQASFGKLDMDIERNSYGRQIDSDYKTVHWLGKNIDAMFIRAPRIVRHRETVLGQHGNDAVAIHNEKIVATTFHPEMSSEQGAWFYAWLLEFVDPRFAEMPRDDAGNDSWKKI